MLSVTNVKYEIKHNNITPKEEKMESDDDDDCGITGNQEDGGDVDFASNVEDYEEQGFLWMCALCEGQPTFETIYDLFNHKKGHGTDANDSSDPVKLELDGIVAEALSFPSSPANNPDVSDSDSDHVDPLSHVSKAPSPTSSEDIPLSNLSSKLNSLKNKRHLRKSQRKAVRAGRKRVKNKTDENTPQQLSNDNGDGDVKEELSTKKALEEYNEVTEDEDVEDERKVKQNHVCKICNLDCQTRGLLSEHKKVHLFEGTGCYKCETCGKMCPKYDNFTRHLTIHHENRVKCHKCEHCYASFYNLADLKRHTVLHMSVKPFTCEHCGEGFTREDNLLIHAYKHTGVQYKKFACKECDKVLNSPSALVMHLKTHTVKSVFCPEPDCKFSCYLKSQLRQHLRKHSGEKPFQCSKCGRCFARSNDMKNHVMNVHDRIRPFKCPYCPKEFALVGNLRIHYTTHTNERPYLCAQCGKSFNHPSTLRKHSVIMHNPWRVPSSRQNKLRIGPYSVAVPSQRGEKRRNKKEERRNSKKVSASEVPCTVNEFEVKPAENKGLLGEYLLHGIPIDTIQLPHVTVQIPVQSTVAQPFVVSTVLLDGDLQRATFIATQCPPEIQPVQVPLETKAGLNSTT